MKNLKNHSSNFDDLLFESRNKNYGAYMLRKEYEESLLKSFLIAMLAVLLFAGVYLALNRNHSESLLPAANKYIEQIEIEIDLSHLNQPKKVESAPSKPEESTTSASKKNDVVVLVKDELPLIKELLKDPNDALLTSNNLQKIGDAMEPLPGKLGADTKKEELLGLGLNEAPKNLAELDVQPEFPGGIKKLMEFLEKNVSYPMAAKENGIKGTVYATFMADKFGKVKDVKIKRGIFSACDEEVLRVVNLFPDWKPGLYKGENVSVIFNLPVRFDLRE